MAEIISCPSCIRKLTVRQEMAVGQLLKCPACQTIFNLPARETPVRPDATMGHGGTRTSSAAGADFAERPLQFRAAREDVVDAYEEEGDYDWPDIRRPVPKAQRKLKLALLIGGGALALLALVFCAHVVVGSRSNPAIIGSWRGTFQFPHVGPMDCTYRFRPNGTIMDEHINPFTGMPEVGTGRYTYANGEVSIRWNQGFERAHVRRHGPNAIEYEIVAHSDLGQIGARATMRRVP